MREELHAYLDGELGREGLPPELRAEAERWEAFLADIADQAPAEAPAWLQAGVMRDLRTSAASHHPAWLAWLVRPRAIRVSPLAAAAVLGLLLLVAIRPWSGGPSQADLAGAGNGEAEPVVYVQFLVEAPSARTVAVAGDFSGWKPTIRLDDADGDGVWSGRARLAPGVHQYMFVLDGSTWVTDPHAERYSDDGFGNRNAVLAVATPPSGT
ncbi:MAG: glycogen-binding domain-containing protein [Gemmatimonadota bacterium]